MDILIKDGERLLGFGGMILVWAGKIATGDRQLTPNDVKIFNPAFDVTPAENITAIITERGVIEKTNARKIAKHLAIKS